MQNIAGAEPLSDVEGHMCGAGMQGADALPRSKTLHRVGDPITRKQTTPEPGRSHVWPGGSRRAGPHREGEEP